MKNLFASLVLGSLSLGTSVALADTHHHGSFGHVGGSHGSALVHHGSVVSHGHSFAAHGASVYRGGGVHYGSHYGGHYYGHNYGHGYGHGYWSHGHWYGGGLGYGYAYPYYYGGYYDPGYAVPDYYGNDYYGGPAYAAPDNGPAQGGDSSMVAAVQNALSSQGFPTGGTDGVMGPMTSRAIARYQSAHGLPVTGQIDDSLIRSLGLQ